MTTHQWNDILNKVHPYVDLDQEFNQTLAHDTLQSIHFQKGDTITIPGCNHPFVVDNESHAITWCQMFASCHVNNDEDNIKIMQNDLAQHPSQPAPYVDKENQLGPSR